MPAANVVPFGRVGKTSDSMPSFWPIAGPCSWSRTHFGESVPRGKYHELVEGERCRLIVVALETGGRWSSEAMDFVTDLARARARTEPPPLRGSAFFAWRRRWTRMLAVSCARAFASSLVSTLSVSPEGQDGHAPDLADLFAS